ncbi:MAG TPA: type II secretion system F family protein [Vicinamibacterales bacterium]|nr:type II secretion system F family protein [Vicinamibacterales bacterium]
MLIALAVFTVVMLIILGAYFLLVVRDERKLLERLTPQAASRKRGLKLGVIKAEERLSNLDAFDKILRRSNKYVSPVKTFVQQSGVRFTLGTFLLSIGCLGLLGFVVAFRFSSSLWLGVLGAFLGGLLPYIYVKRARNKRLLKFEEQFPEAIDLVARALRAGHSLPTGLSMVADELAAPVGTEFRTLYDEQNYGLTLPEALRNFAGRIPVLDARFFVTAVLTQREAGGNLAEVLDNLAEVIRARFKVKRQVRVISAHGRITGWVLAGLPPSVAVASFIISPVHMQTLLGDPIGINMIMAACVMQVLGTLIIRKIVDIEY